MLGACTQIPIHVAVVANGPDDGRFETIVGVAGLPRTPISTKAELRFSWNFIPRLAPIALLITLLINSNR
jgi:hypothetical protein